MTTLAPAFRLFLMGHKDRDVQICLRGCGPMSGKVTSEVVSTDAESITIYQIRCAAQMGQGAPVMTMPFFFLAEDLVWYSPGAVESEKPRIQGPWGS